jgi:hypothetical protein
MMRSIVRWSGRNDGWLFAAAAAAVLFGSACFHMETTTREEKGLTLRNFHREEKVGEGVSARLEITWPMLRAEVSGFDVCRDSVVEEAVVTSITERSSRATGPALSTGITNLGASGILFGTSFLASAAPDYGSVDADGRPGLSARATMQTVSLVTLIVGAPALVVGLISAAQSGEQTEERAVERVVEAHEIKCHHRPLSGPVALMGLQGLAASGAATEGLLEVDVSKLQGPLIGLGYLGRPMELEGDGEALLEAVSECLALEGAGTTSLSGLDEGSLRSLSQRWRTCRLAMGTKAAPFVAAVDAELGRRWGTDEDASRPRELTPH